MTILSSRTGTFWLRCIVAQTAIMTLACGDSTGIKGEILIATDAPTSVTTNVGLPTQFGAQYAVISKATVRGFKVSLKPYDDGLATPNAPAAANPQKGADNVKDMLTDPKVLGLVGGVTSGIVRAEMPALNQGNLALISPSATNECLTRTFPYCNPQPADLRPNGTNNFFRLAAADTFQGPAMADYGFDLLKIKNAAVWTDGGSYGKGVADRFSAQLTKRGGQIVLRQDMDVNTTTDFTDFLNQAKAKGAQALYTGWNSGPKVCLAMAQAKTILGGDTFFLGPDGFINSACLKDTQATDRSYGTLPTTDATQNTNARARSVVTGFQKKYPDPAALGTNTFVAYDCASILLDAIERAIDSNGGNLPSRAQVVAAVAKTKKFKGVTGEYTFDKYGDPTQPTIAFDRIQGTPPKWTYADQYAVGET